MREASVSEMSPHLSSALWFLAGGIAGAGIGLLLAPQSGRATRQSMGRGMSGGAKSARRLRDRVVSRSEEIWGEAAQRVDDAASALSGAAERKAGNRTEAPPA